MSEISLDDLEYEIAEAVEGFLNDKEESARKVVKHVALACRSDVKASAPTKTGAYRDGWTTKADGDSMYGFGVRVFNSKKPQITHLLEKGHAKRGGGRISGTPHIAPAADRAQKQLMQEMKRI